MTTNPAPGFPGFFDALVARTPIVCLSDFDRTVPVTEDGKPTDAFLEVVERIIRAGGTFGITSARPLSELVAWFGHIENILLIANDGCVIKYGETEISIVGRHQRIIEAMGDAVAFASGRTDARAADMDRFLGIFIKEDNPDCERAFAVLDRHSLAGETVARRHPDGVTLEPANKPGKEDLGSIEGVLGIRNPYWIYTGDGQNDENAQRRVKQLGGHSVKVLRTAAPTPDYVNATVVGTDGCLAFWRDIAEQMEGHRA